MKKIENLKIAIIDYGMGNLFSVLHAFESLGAKPVITTDIDYIIKADAALLPGVGAFGDAMQNMEKLDLILPIQDFISSGKPFMGVCLGMQLLFSESSEFGLHQGLGIIEGKVQKFPDKNKFDTLIRVPQIGWNTIQKPENKSWKNTPLDKTQENEFMYFVHSYCGYPADKTWILTETEYEKINYTSSVGKDKVVAFQFHPEKSGPEGIKIYERWLELV